MTPRPLAFATGGLAPGGGVRVEAGAPVTRPARVDRVGWGGRGWPAPRVGGGGVCIGVHSEPHAKHLDRVAYSSAPRALPLLVGGKNPRFLASCTQPAAVDFATTNSSATARVGAFRSSLTPLALALR